MAKAREKADKAPLGETEAQEAPAEASSGPVEEAAEAEESRQQGDELPYTVGQWRGLFQYRCKLCAFDVLDDEQKILEHVQGTHQAPPSPSTILVANRHGREI